MARKTEWWHQFFTSFRPVFDGIPVRSNNAIARFIIKKLGLKPGQNLLDCPCGIGRIAFPLARKGIRVTGVDFMPEYIDEMTLKARKKKLKIDGVCEDMRRIKFKNQFDGGANIWTSIGFFDKDSDNLLVIKKMFRALKPGGKFMASVTNRDYVISHFTPHNWFDTGRIKVLQEATFDYSTSRLNAVWNFIRDGKETPHEMLVRIYSFHELVAMFRTAGFVNIEGFGSIKEEPITYNTPMIYIVGTKPKK